MLTIGLIVGGIIWFIGSCSTVSDLIKHGKSMDEYRTKYGHDLGMLVCCSYRGSMVAAWPIVGLGGFGIGVIRDTARLALGRKPRVEK